MPLTEISSNIRRSDSTSRVKPLSEAGSGVGSSIPPSAIQSMLRTTTELGDIGLFATRPPRIPHSSSRIQTRRPRSGSFDTALPQSGHSRSSHIRNSGRPPGPRPTRSMSGLSARHASRSNMSSLSHTGRAKKYSHSMHPRSLQGIASPVSDSRGLYTHRSLATLRSHRDIRSLRSSSPMMHHHQMRRRGHRASSPAISDMRSFSGTPRPFMRAPSALTVASSPSSIFLRRPGLVGYRSDFNASHASLARMPSPAVSFMRNGQTGTPGPSMRAPTPISASFYGSRSIMSKTAVSISGMPRSPTGSTVPAYYDYSESFVEEDCFSPDGGHDAGVPPLTIDQTVSEGISTPPPRDAQTPFGTREGSEFHPSELPSNHDRHKSESSKQSKRSSRSKRSRRSKHSFNGVIPKRVSSLAAPAMSKANSEHSGFRRAHSEDGGASDAAKATREERRASIASKRSNTPSSTSIFFPNAERSSRDLTTLAARVHSPAVDVKRAAKHADMTPTKNLVSNNGLCAANFEGKNTPNWQLPALIFRPISFAQYSPTPSSRPKTSEATPGRTPLEILSPMPERPMSSQSRKRFSKILEIEEGCETNGTRPFPRYLPRRRMPVLSKVEEAPILRQSLMSIQTIKKVDSISQDLPSPPKFSSDGAIEGDNRVSTVTSHDKSTIESLLDKHIECLGLGADSDVSSEGSTSLQNRQLDESSSTQNVAYLMQMLAAAPRWNKGRPWTSSSQQPSSLGATERQRLRPRRLFASMDAGLCRSVEGHLNPAISSDSIGTRSRPSYGWQTLPSASELKSPASESVYSVLSGDLGDIDSSDRTAKLQIKRRSELSHSASTPSRLSDLSAKASKEARENKPPQRSKSDLLERQASHRRRRMRIIFKLKTRSQTLGDLPAQANAHNFAEAPGPKTIKSEVLRTRISVMSPVAGYAELSGDSMLPSMTVLSHSMPGSPPIPTRWSSIVAAMPEPVKQSIELVRQASKRSTRSHRSNISIVQPMNTTRLNYALPRLGSIPKLQPPEFGPTITSSELNLSIPYADMPSTIRPTLRETRSFFSDNSSAQRQRRSLRQKFTLRSLRHAIPGSSGTSLVAEDVLPRGDKGVNLRHSCQMKGRNSADEEPSAGADDLLPMSDFAYKKRKLIEKVKDWWRRQCVTKRLASMRRRDQSASSRGMVAS